MLYSAFRVVGMAASLLSVPVLSAQDVPPAHQPRPKFVGPAKWETSAHEASVAYWTLEPGWNTTLEMRNNVTHHELTVRPVLRENSGQETALNPVTIPPQHVVSLDLRKAALAEGISLGSFGSVVFRYDSLDGGNLFAAAIVRREGQPIDFHFDAEGRGSEYKSGGVEGMWWLPAASSTDYLILSNPLKKTVIGTLVLSSSSASRRLQINLNAGETKRIDLREVLGPSSVGAVGGLSLLLSGKELISATQIVFDEVTGLAAIMKMFEREPDDQPKSRVLLAPMMALDQPDQVLGFPSGTQLLPRVFLRNAGIAPMRVLTTVNWRNQVSGTFALPALTLASGEVRTISLSEYEQTGQIPPDATWGTLKLAYTGRSADLVAVAVSYDKESRYGLQTPFSEGLSHMWAGGMWHVDATHNTLITTGNGGSEDTKAEVTLFYNGGKGRYRMEKMLAPGQQLWLDVGHLVHDQVADADGHTLPPDTMTGSYELRDLDHALVGSLYEGKLVIDKTYGHASYGCSTCCGYSTTILGPSPFGGPPGINNSDFIHATETCGGSVDDVTDGGYNWGSSNTGVATLPNSTLHTVAVGSATGGTRIDLESSHPEPSGNCLTTPRTPQQSVQVSNPTISKISPAQGLVGTAINVTITGTNFAAGASVKAGSNISVSNVNVTSSTQITATFTSTNSTSAGGNQGVTVTVGSAPSNSYNFFVQIPTHFQRYDVSGAPGGIGPVIPVTNGNVVALNGTVLVTHYCGVYENFAFDIADQNSNQITNGSVTITEVFSNITHPPGPTPTVTTIDLSSQAQADTQAYGFAYPTCLANNQNQSLNMTWTVKIGTVNYPVTTLLYITKGNFNGTLNVTSAITTQ